MISDELILRWRKMARFYAGAMPREGVSLEVIFQERYVYWESRIKSSTATWTMQLTWTIIGLMTYGHKKGLELAIENIPPMSPFNRMGVYACEVFVHLLPVTGKLKNDYYLPANKDELLDWYIQHLDRLVWSKDENRFVLVDDTSKIDSPSIEE